MPGTHVGKRNRADLPSPHWLSRTGLSVLVAAVAVTLHSSCGIETYPYLFPPTVPRIPLYSEPLFEFRNDVRNDVDYFEGYELYYKLYAFAAGEGAVQAEEDAESLAEEEGPTYIESIGFSRLDPFEPEAEETEPSPLPLLSLRAADRGDSELVFQIDFAGVREDLPRSLYGDLSFGRTVTDSEGESEFRGFAPDEFLEGDSDLPEEFDPEADTTVYVALCALSYGNDIVTFNFNLYSAPAYLGVIELSLTP